jgi:copper chaperone CopZ
MIHDYTISGMTCSGCEATVKNLLSKVEGVKQVTINLLKGAASVEMDKHVATNELQKALAAHPKYQLSEKTAIMPPAFTESADEKKSWFETYKPILLIFFYITLVTFMASFSAEHFSITLAMRVFMAAFFLVFSFFKLLDINGFADSYMMYDIVAKKIRTWGIVYPFVELTLGIAYAINFQPIFINSITLVVMGISITGVLQSVLNKRKIKCACLGSVFNLPMSTITIIEDGLMIAMSVAMLFMML